MEALQLEVIEPSIAVIEHQVAQEARTLAEQAHALTVVDSAGEHAAAAFLSAVVAAKKWREAEFEPLVSAAHRSWRLLTEKRALVLGQFTEPERIVKLSLASYRIEQERQHQEAERAAAEAARAEAERRQLEFALRAEQQGDTERAERILEAPPPLVSVPSVTAPIPQKIDGVSYVETWQFAIVDEAALPREFMVPDLKRIGAVVRAMKGAVKIAGVKTWAEKSVRAR